MPTISVIIPVYKVERYLGRLRGQRGGADLSRFGDHFG